MLAAVGIESSPALVNLGNAYVLPKVPTLGLLNHAITYVPSLNLYLDSTAEGIAAGYLPVPVLDKPVVLSKSGDVGHTPTSQEGLVEKQLAVQGFVKRRCRLQPYLHMIGWAAEVIAMGSSR